MKILFLLLSLVGVAAFIQFQPFFKKTIRQPITMNPQSTHEPDVITRAEEKTSLFVPYWTLSTVSTNYDGVIYFGIGADLDGIKKDDAGYKQLLVFNTKTANFKERLLTIRMTETSTNSQILKDKSAQEKIISESLMIAEDYDFEGIVLDFEMNALPFDAVLERVSNFYKSFSEATRKEQMSFFVTLYGDTFYRARPYNVEYIGKVSDGVFIMAYDFHKAKGNPGPNFPLGGEEIYGYDFAKMMKDFLRVIPREKITVIFGLYGYDWRVNEKSEALGVGKALSYNKINQDFLQECSFTSCSMNEDKISAEKNIVYTDEKGQRHIVWFEDSESIEKKKMLLKKNGITSFSLWANSYF